MEESNGKPAWNAAQFLSDAKSNTWRNSQDTVGLTKLGTHLKNVVKDHDTAEAVFRRCLELDPGMNAALLNLGSILTNVKQDYKVYIPHFFHRTRFECIACDNVFSIDGVTSFFTQLVDSWSVK